MITFEIKDLIIYAMILSGIMLAVGVYIACQIIRATNYNNNKISLGK